MSGRGLAYWSEGDEARIIYVTPGYRMLALDAATGELLWKASLGGQIVMAPVTFMVDGRQYVSVISGHTLVTFGLRD